MKPVLSFHGFGCLRESDAQNDASQSTILSHYSQQWIGLFRIWPVLDPQNIECRLPVLDPLRSRYIKPVPIRAAACIRAPVVYPGNLIFCYPTQPGYPKSKNHRLCPRKFCSTKTRNFSFNNHLYLCSSVEFVSNQKMTIPMQVGEW